MRTEPAHGHLWSSAEGTGLHAPHGELAREDGTGRVCCHLCGQWFRALGSHVRVHGYTAAGYRAEMGLGTRTALTAPEISAGLSARQASRYRASVEVRAAFAVGQAMARTGELGQRSAAARAAGDRPQRRSARRYALERGRATVAARREEELARRLGTASLPDHLRRRYAEGASMETLAEESGLGRDRLRQAMDAAGIARRAPGDTSPAGRRSRAVRADAAAAARVGVEDLTGWLARQRAAGRTYTELARAVGHSPPWVRSRLS